MASRGPEPNVTDKELIDAVVDAFEDTRGPVVSTAEIAANAGISGTRIRERVKGVEKIQTKKIGGGPRVYWLSE